MPVDLVPDLLEVHPAEVCPTADQLRLLRGATAPPPGWGAEPRWMPRVATGVRMILERLDASLNELELSTGWAAKSEGACKG